MPVYPGAQASPLRSLTVFSVPRAKPQNNQSTTWQEWHSLLRLCRGAGVHPDGGRVVGLTCVNPNLTEPAIGIRSEDDVRLLGSAAPARSYNVDRFLCDVEIIAQIPGTGLF